MVLLSFVPVLLATVSLALPQLVTRNNDSPATVVLSGGRLATAKYRIGLKDKLYMTQLGYLTKDADSWLGQGPWTVTDKPMAPENGTMHDYSSRAPYWWPTSAPTAENPFGCPYEERDGQRNPDVDTATDRRKIGYVTDSVYSLSLAWYYTGESKYSEHASKILRTWFLDEETRMNPDLEHSQAIPCQHIGRAVGIIDFSQMYTSVLDAVRILGTGAPGWTTDDSDAFTEWNKQFLAWLRDSKLGQEASELTNNHGIFYDMQLAAIAHFVGDEALAKDTVVASQTKRIAAQIAADGSQPGEAKRTRSWHYHTFNLVALMRLAKIGAHVGVDLWAYESPEGASIRKAIEFLVPVAAGEAEWTMPELEFERYAASDIVHAAADAGVESAKAIIRKLQMPPKGDWWYLRPAPEQLDSIVR